jgi:hypothetical protein
MIRNVIVIDEFLDNIADLQGAAKRIQFPDKTEDTNFPGRNSDKAVAIHQLTEMVSHIVGERLAPSYRNAHAKMRLTLAEDKGLANVHVDNCYWSGILYLRGHADPKHGTQFFRHKRTSSDRTAIRPSEYADFGVKNDDELVTEVIGKDGLDPDAWDNYMTVPAVENRLLLLRPWMWHTAGPGFGNSLDDGRLIYLMFFDKAA